MSKDIDILENVIKELESHNESFLALLNFLPHCYEPMEFLRHWMEGSWEYCHEWDEEIMESCPELFAAIYAGETDG
tara:strand:- start:2099 stop:2326 length:228 start_codon:yes stop_codon:yes gene_type:complete